MMQLRTYLAIVLAALLAFASYGGASAQMMRDATGQMVICTGTGAVTIYVDDDGQPAAPPHPCTECISPTQDAALVQSAPLPKPAPQIRSQVAAVDFSAPTALLRAWQARAPPVAA